MTTDIDWKYWVDRWDRMQERHLIFPRGNGPPLLLSAALLGCHHPGNRAVELGFRVQGTVVVILFGHLHQRFRHRPIFVHVGRRHRGIKAREGETRWNFV